MVLSIHVHAIGIKISCQCCRRRGSASIVPAALRLARSEANQQAACCWLPSGAGEHSIIMEELAGTEKVPHTACCLHRRAVQNGTASTRCLLLQVPLNSLEEKWDEDGGYYVLITLLEGQGCASVMQQHPTATITMSAGQPYHVLCTSQQAVMKLPAATGARLCACAHISQLQPSFCCPHPPPYCAAAHNTAFCTHHHTSK
jgi:hypothetical protein